MSTARKDERRGDSGHLLYIGQGKLRSRLNDHSKKPIKLAQGTLFQDEHTEATWVSLPGMTSNQLQELENDLIASYFLTTGQVPEAQFLGNRDA